MKRRESKTENIKANCYCLLTQKLILTQLEHTFPTNYSKAQKSRFFKYTMRYVAQKCEAGTVTLTIEAEKGHPLLVITALRCITSCSFFSFTRKCLLLATLPYGTSFKYFYKEIYCYRQSRQGGLTMNFK